MKDSVMATVNIMGRPYRLRIALAEEEYLRKAADVINSQAKAYGENFAYKDHQDLLSMVALTQITQMLKLQDNQKFMNTELESRLMALNELLDQQK